MALRVKLIVQQPGDIQVEAAIEAARAGRLVVFVGAGVSMIEPTNLPSWATFNREVLEALATSVEGARVASEFFVKDGVKVIRQRQERGLLPPEYQAEAIATEAGHSWFEVLRCLDSADPNPVHLGLAALAGAGAIRAIVTTNFDRALEAAFRTTAVSVDLRSSYDDFSELAREIARGRFDWQGGKAPYFGGQCQVLKIHGSAEDPASLVDTLAQRLQGFPRPLQRCLRFLRLDSHWLFLGYSGADLAANPEHLYLRDEPEKSHGISWLVRQNQDVPPPVTRLADDLGDHAVILRGDLPEALDPLITAIGVEVPPPGAPSAPAQTETTIRAHARAWASEQGPAVCTLSMARLFDAAGSSVNSASLLRFAFEKWPADQHGTVGYARLAAARARLLMADGEIEDALALFEESYRTLVSHEPDRVRYGSNLHSVRVLPCVGECQRLLGRHAEAAETFDAVLDKSDRGWWIHGPELVAARIGQARIRFGDGRVDDAHAALIEAAEFADKAGDATGEADHHIATADLFRLTGKTDVARDRYGLADAIGARLGNPGTRARAICGLGYTGLAENDAEAARKCFNTVLGWIGPTGVYDRATQALAHTGLGHALVKLGELQPAIANHQMALGLIGERPLYEATGWTHLHLGILASAQGNTDAEREHLGKSATAFRTIRCRMADKVERVVRRRQDGA